MKKYLSTSLNNVSMDLESSWGLKALKEVVDSKVGYARFQQRQMQEKEEKLVKLYENQQQRAFDKIGRGSAGSNDSLSSSTTGMTGGKVRQMFDERRQKAGVDKSYPLEPLKSKSNPRKTTVISTIKTTTNSTVSKNGRPLVKKKEVTTKVGKQSFEESAYVDGDNVNNSKSYREIIEMLDNNNLMDNLENEKMPQYNLDEGDNNFKGETRLDSVKNNNNNNTIVKKMQPKSKVENVNVKNETLATKKSNLTTVKRTPLKPTVSSPRNSVPNSPAKKDSNLVMQEKSKTTMPPRTPSSTRPSSKQQSPRSVVNRDDLTECTYCGRRFAEDRIQKHEDVCSKTGKKKRKAYDATKHRVLGTELESYVLRGPKSKTNNTKPTTRNATKKDWRRTHEEFISAIRAAKEAQAHVAKGGKLSDLPPPPPSSNPDYVQCPHCERRFNAAAAERHIPKCADYQFNKPKAGGTAKGKTNNKR